jgi:hypothetical protein
MLHASLRAEMLDDEVLLAAERLGHRSPGIAHDGRYVTCPMTAQDGTPVLLRLDAAQYDAEPVRVDVCDLAGSPLAAPMWPTGLLHSIHPVTGRPFVCIQGVYEYYIHPSHHKDRWDSVRATHRISRVLDHLLQKAGQ